MFVRHSFGSVLLLIALAAPVSAVEPPAEWPQLLGPDRNGISSETGLLDAWPAGGPKEVWRVKGGIGMAGLAISRGKLITMVQRGGQQKLIALSADTGEPLWEADIAPTYKNQMGDGPRGTPTIAGDRVYVFTGEGVLAAVKFSDGKPLWSKNVLKELDGEPADYGMACSPLVVSDQVIVTLGAPQAAVAAFDAKSGELAWAAGNDPAGYSSPALLEVGGRKQVVAYTGGSVLGLEPGKGTILWRYPYETDFGCNIATPLAYKGQVFVSSGENHGSVLLAIKPTAGKQQVSEVWTSNGPKSVLRNEWQTSILLDDHLYGFDNVGGAGPVSHLTCINAATGERAWQELRFGKGNLIAAEGKLFMSTLAGELVIARASPQKYEELGRKAVIGKTRTAPSLAGGLLYLRDEKDIVCLDVRR
jgi:outer membrane protein assembly factor BamB